MIVANCSEVKVGVPKNIEKTRNDNKASSETIMGISGLMLRF